MRSKGGSTVTLNSENAQLLRQALTTGLLDVSLHGHLHQESGTTRDGRKSEFSGVPLQLQRGWIRSGKTILEDVLQTPINGFVPPWNSCDAATIWALRDEGFVYLSANRRQHPDPSSKLRFLPITCGLRNLMAAIRQARKFAWFDPVVICVMHHYDFEPDLDDPAVGPYSYTEFGGLLDEIKSLPDVQLATLGQLANRLTPWQSCIWSKQAPLRAQLPWRLQSVLPDSCLLTRLLPNMRAQRKGSTFTGTSALPAR